MSRSTSRTTASTRSSVSRARAEIAAGRRGSRDDDERVAVGGLVVAVGEALAGRRPLSSPRLFLMLVGRDRRRGASSSRLLPVSCPTSHCQRASTSSCTFCSSSRLGEEAGSRLAGTRARPARRPRRSSPTEGRQRRRRGTSSSPSARRPLRVGSLEDDEHVRLPARPLGEPAELDHAGLMVRQELVEPRAQLQSRGQQRADDGEHRAQQEAATRVFVPEANRASAGCGRENRASSSQESAPAKARPLPLHHSMHLGRFPFRRFERGRCARSSDARRAIWRRCSHLSRLERTSSTLAVGVISDSRS